MSAADLLGCFDLAAEVRCAAVAGYLRELIVHVLAEEERWQLLRWCTSHSALPATGLDPQDRVTLVFKETPSGGAPADQWLPVAHTCTSEVELPAYSCRAALERQLRRAMSDMASGGGFGEL